MYWVVQISFEAAGGFLSHNEQDNARYTNQFLLQDQIPDLPFPFRGRVREFRVEFLSTLPISGTLADLEFDQEFSGGIFSLGQDLVPVELGSRRKLKIGV